MKNEKKWQSLLILNLILSFLVIVFLASFILVHCLGKEMTPEDIFSKAKESVVELKAEKEGKNPSYGSAIFVSKDGELVSNAHVVTYSSNEETKPFDTFSIRFYRSDIYCPVSLIRYDIARDICILKYDVEEETGYQPIVFSGSALKEGQKVYAVGNMLNHGIGITSGIISVPLLNLSDGDSSMNLIQAEIIIANGSSGGALLDANGQLIGMTTLRIRNQTGNIEYGIGYSIPSKEILSYLNG